MFPRKDNKNHAVAVIVYSYSVFFVENCSMEVEETFSVCETAFQQVKHLEFYMGSIPIDPLVNKHPGASCCKWVIKKRLGSCEVTPLL